MDFSTDDTYAQQVFRREVREWLVGSVPRLTGDQGTEETYQLLREFGRRLGDRGWLYPTAPTEYGGGGLPAHAAVVIAQELASYDLGLPPFPDSGSALAGQCIQLWGSEEQKQRILPRIIRGEAVTWVLATGPEGGSDFAATSTTARWEDGKYVLNGVMAWVQGSVAAEYMWTLVRTGPEEARYQNLSWFMIPGDTPGIRVRPMELLADGQLGGQKNVVHLDDVHVSARNLIGGLNNGWRVAQTFLALKHGMRGESGVRGRHP